MVNAQAINSFVLFSCTLHVPPGVTDNEIPKTHDRSIANLGLILANLFELLNKAGINNKLHELLYDTC